MLLTILIFILILGLLVFVHELGHFLVAKKFGMRVEEFGFGFPPRLFSFQHKETTYSINLIPLGGFVKIQGEDGELRGEKGSFGAHSLWRRALTLVAGVSMNFLLALILIVVGYRVGLPTAIDSETKGNLKNPKVQIAEVLTNSPASSTGLEIGDTILQANSENILNIVDFQRIINSFKGQEVNLLIERGGKRMTLKGTPRVDFPTDEGPLGVGLVKTAIVSYPLPKAVQEGVIDTFYSVKMIIVTFYNLIGNLIVTGKVSADLSGPVGVAVITGKVARLGFIYLLQFTAVLSLNLAVINILPIPALDGGRLLFLGIEGIIRKPINQKVERFVNSIGFISLLCLMALVTFRDFFRFGIIEKLKNFF